MEQYVLVHVEIHEQIGLLLACFAHLIGLFLLSSTIAKLAQPIKSARKSNAFQFRNENVRYNHRRRIFMFNHLQRTTS